MFAIYPIPSHSNSSILTGMELIDLNNALNAASVGEGGTFFKSPGFNSVEAANYFVDPVNLPASISHILNFDGVNQALMMRYDNDAVITPSADMSISFWVRFRDFLWLGQEETKTFLSTRGDFLNFDYTDITNTDDAISGVDIAIRRDSGVLHLLARYSGSPGICDVNLGYETNLEGLWIYVTFVKKDGVSQVLKVNNIFNSVVLLPDPLPVNSGGKLILGAALSGSITDTGFDVLSYIPMQVYGLTIWNNLDIAPESHIIRHLNPVEHHVGVPSSVVRDDFKDAMAVSAFYRMTPTESQVPGIYRDSYDRFDWVVRGKEGKYLGTFDAEANTDVMTLDGLDDHLELRNRVVGEVQYTLGDNTQIPVQRRFELPGPGNFFSFNRDFTFECWIKPDSTFELYNNNSVGSGYFTTIFGTCLFDMLPVDVEQVQALLASDPAVTGGFTVSIGKSSASTAIITAAIIIPESQQLMYATVSFTHNVNTNWDWLNIQTVVDTSAKKLYLYVTERGDLTPTYSDDVDLNYGTNTTINLQDILLDNTHVNTLRVGARNYINPALGVADFYRGRLVDVRLWKGAQTLEQLNSARYKIVSPT
jgi:hypothetical protein